MGTMKGTGVMIVEGVLRYEGEFKEGKWGEKGVIYTKDKEIRWENKDAFEMFRKLRINEDLIIELLEKYIFRESKNLKRRVL